MAAEKNGSTPDVTILGAGIVGITTALSLTERGFKVALIDRNPPAEGASYGNAGSLSPWSCVPQSMPGLWKSIPGWLLDPEGPVALRTLATSLPAVVNSLTIDSTGSRKLSRGPPDYASQERVDASGPKTYTLTAGEEKIELV